MATQFESADGRRIHVRLPGDPEFDPENLDDLDENSETEAVVLVEQHNAMTVEGAIAGAGVVARKLANGHTPQATGNWWHDWGKYVIPIVVVIVGGLTAQILLR